MKKLCAILLLSLALPLCAMEGSPPPARPSVIEGMDQVSRGGDGGGVVTGIVGQTPSPVRPQGLSMSPKTQLGSQALLFPDGKEPSAPAFPSAENGDAEADKRSKSPSPSPAPAEEAGNASPISKWYSPTSPVFRIMAPTSLAAIIMGGYLTRRHVQRQRALGKQTVFDRMWSKSKQWAKKAERLVHRENKQA